MSIHHDQLDQLTLPQSLISNDSFDFNSFIFPHQFINHQFSCDSHLSDHQLFPFSSFDQTIDRFHLAYPTHSKPISSTTNSPASCSQSLSSTLITNPSQEQEPKFLPEFQLPLLDSSKSNQITPLNVGLDSVARTGNTGGRSRRVAPANRKCEYCGAQFTRNDRLKYHVESSHLRLEPAFKCQKKGCQRAFRQRSDLVRHLRHVHHDL